MSNHTPPVFGGTALNQFSFKLRGEKWIDGDWKSPELTLDMVNNNPRMTVFCNNPNEENKTRVSRGKEKPLKSQPINGRMKWSDFFKFLYLLDQVIDAKDPVSYTMSLKGSKFDDNGEKIKGEFVVESRLQWGLNSDGMVFLKLYEKDREKPLFVFGDEFWAPIQKDEVDMTPSENSRLAARGFFNGIKAVLGPVIVNYYIPDAGRKMQTKSPAKHVDDLGSGDAEVWN